ISRTAPGFLLFVQQGKLVARPFDVSRGELGGDPVTVADLVGFDSATNAGAFSVSAAGPIAYRSGRPALHQLVWFDRAGKPVGATGETDAASLIHAELSPDGRRIAVSRVVQYNEDVYLIDTARGVPTRFTSDPASDRLPIWSNDGNWVVFASNRTGKYDLYRKPASGAATEELLAESPQHKAAADWSPDGRFLLYSDTDPKTGTDLWKLALTGDDRKPSPVIRTPFDERNAQFSPDGRWVAYQSNENGGRFEVYVQSFPVLGEKWQVSNSGGISPRWRRDGKEIFYIAPDAKMMAAPVRISGSAFESIAPVALFQTRIYGSGSFSNAQYSVSRDGRFLINTVAEDAAPAPIMLLQNWRPPAK